MHFRDKTANSSITNVQIFIATVVSKIHYELSQTRSINNEAAFKMKTTLQQEVKKNWVETSEVWKSFVVRDKQNNEAYDGKLLSITVKGYVCRPFPACS